ncbi:MAG: 5-bromo-4-chloroindolyl phosphate hydrolysis family protein [Pseudomonadota bacterium]
MDLPDGPRQIVAALLGSFTFVGLFFGLSLIWWLSLVLALAVYGASLLLIQRRRLLSEVKLTSRVSAADVQLADNAIRDAQSRLTSAMERAPEPDQNNLSDMIGDLSVIRENIVDDPEDLRVARSFINVQLPEIVRAVETYVKLADRATPETQHRITDLGTRIRDFSVPIRRIRTASVENDLHALDVEVSTLSKTLNRR